MQQRILNRAAISYGTDPEGFLKLDGRIIGSEKVIPEDGIRQFLNSHKPMIIRDGVQFEFNPPPSYTIFGLATSISDCFRTLHETLRDHKGVEICFDEVVHMSQEEMETLSPKSRRFGCEPSENYYGERIISVDPLTYMGRSAGGHIHLGIDNKQMFDNRVHIIPLLDIFVGNTCVLLDRDPLQIERRSLTYGRAGEYRKQPHGIEYRTLSNFWLKDHALLDLVLEMSGMAYAILYDRVCLGNDLEKFIVEKVDIDQVIEAIDTNNYVLARKNFVEVVMPFISNYIEDGYYPRALGSGNMEKFLRFTDMVEARGLEMFIAEDPVKHWLTGIKETFCRFLDKVKV